MKPIEQKVADAIAELEGLLLEGQAPDVAIPLAAATEDLKPDVLQSRAVKALGDLQAVKFRNDAAVATLAQRNKESRAIYEFAEMDKVYADFSQWFLEKTGRIPTNGETKEMERLSMEALLRKLVINI